LKRLLIPRLQTPRRGFGPLPQLKAGSGAYGAAITEPALNAAVAKYPELQSDATKHGSRFGAGWQPREFGSAYGFLPLVFFMAQPGRR
jgi:hypothetical protein